MRSRLIVLFSLCLTAARSAQPLSARDADLVFVGTIVSGQGIDHGPTVNCNVSVSLTRVLKGDLQPGQTMALAWQYEPQLNQGLQITTKVPKGAALFFLRKNEEAGDYQVIRAGSYTLSMGGYLLPVPSGPLHSPYLYTAASSFEVMLAGELGAALEALATKDGDTLDVYLARPPFGGAAVPPKAPQEDVDEYRSLCLLFNGLNAHAAEEVVRYFAGSPLAHLQAIGLLGELKLKDTSAILAMENNMDALGRTWTAFDFSFWASILDLHDKPFHINALGRMAIAESAWFGFDGMVVNTLARSDSLVAVPYLRVMLDNPISETRKVALNGLCATLTHNGESLEGICPVWHPDTDPSYNPTQFGDTYSTPRGNEAEQRVALKAWLAAHHPELSQLLAPAWYNAPTPAPPEERLMSPERHRELAFNAFLIQLSSQSQAVKKALNWTAADFQTLSEFDVELSKQLQATYHALDKALLALRVINQPLDPVVLCRNRAEIDQILREGLSELRARLSAPGSHSLDSYLDRVPVSQSKAGASPWFSRTSDSSTSCPSQ